MKQTTLNRVSATAACLQTEKAEIETQIAAPIKTDLNKHQAQRGFNKSADGSKVNRWWESVHPILNLLVSFNVLKSGG